MPIPLGMPERSPGVPLRLVKWWKKGPSRRRARVMLLLTVPVLALAALALWHGLPSDHLSSVPTTDSLLHQYEAAIVRFHGTAGRLPREDTGGGTVSLVADLTSIGYLFSSHQVGAAGAANEFVLLDSWGTPVLYFTAPPRGFSLASAGMDMRYNTPDDIVLTHRIRP